MRLLEAIVQAAATQLSSYLNNEQPADGYIPALEDALSDILSTQAPKGETRLERLVAKAEEPELFLTVLTLCIAEAVSRDFAAAIEQLGGPTLQLASQLAGKPYSMDRMRTTYRQLSQLLGVKLSALPFFRHPFSADERLLCYLEGDDELDARLKVDGVELILPDDICPAGVVGPTESDFAAWPTAGKGSPGSTGGRRRLGTPVFAAARLPHCWADPADGGLPQNCRPKLSRAAGHQPRHSAGGNAFGHRRLFCRPQSNRFSKRRRMARV